MAEGSFALVDGAVTSRYLPIHRVCGRSIAMFSGIQEILLIVLIVLGIFLIPRMMNPRPSGKKPILQRPIRKLSWRLRLGIVLSVLWPFSCAAYLQPWHHDIVLFIVVGIGPVFLCWGAKWVLEGMKKN